MRYITRNAGIFRADGVFVNQSDDFAFAIRSDITQEAHNACRSISVISFTYGAFPANAAASAHF